MPSDSQYLWSTAHSMRLKPPTIATALSVWISLCAKPGDLGRVGLLGVDLVRDRVAVDAAVVVDAVEVRLRHRGAVGEVGARLLGDDRADLDRRSGGLRARLRPALRHVGGGLRGGRATAASGCSTSSCRCCCCRTRQRAPTGRLRARPAQAHVAASCPSQRSSSRVTLLLLRLTVLSPRFAKRTAVRKTNLLARLARRQGASAACSGEFARASRGHRVHLRHTP